MGLKLFHPGRLEWHYLRAKFHGNLPNGSEIIGRGRDRQTGDFISLFSCFESKVKTKRKL
jgi:hypothetical protein